jgi:hypothetical protein
MDESARRREINALTGGKPEHQAMETDMELHQSPQVGEPRLRVVFANKSIALGLPLGSTLGDIADWICDIARLHNGPLLSIDVRLAAPAGTH